MDIDVMREMMGESKDYYNVLFTDKAIDIDPGRLYSTTSRADVVKGSEVFGYRRSEIRKLYLDGNFYTNVACGMNVETPFIFFAAAFAMIIVLYFVINTILVRRLDKFTPAEILKNRE